ncbi:MAG: hypothetical protein K6E75_06355 [Lachnospiraceae bacterium]|nr:hypothetical protein [Lachnospiraceae bacterium]
MQYMDPSKLVIYVQPGCAKDGEPYRGPQLAAELLATYHLDMEMTAPGYVLAMTSVMDRPEGLQRLLRALFEIDGKLAMKKTNLIEDENDDFCSDKGSDQTGDERKESSYNQNADRVTNDGKKDRGKLTIRRAMDSEAKMVPLYESTGLIAAEFVYRYPPGIPIVAPGEIITKEAVEEILSDEEAGFTLHREGEGILVVGQGV